MSEQESNICEICGGVKRVDWTISFEECHPVQVQFDPASLAGNWRLCPGHPEPDPKHDGKLDERGEYEVSYWQPESRKPFIYIEETNDAKDEPEFVRIAPAQALSLLTWLEQNREKLQQLANRVDIL